LKQVELALFADQCARQCRRLDAPLSISPPTKAAFDMQSTLTAQREAMLGQRPMWIRLKSRRRLNLLRLLQLVQVGVRDEIIFPKTMKSPKQFLRVTVDHRRRANLAKAKLRPGQAPLQGRVGRRCCWIYRLTVARLAPPVEPAK